jgi:hypothetical protein
MAHESKRGFLSSLFRSKKQTEEEEMAELESKHRLEERIQRVLAEKAPAPEVILKEENVVVMQQEEEAEVPVELLPISASVVPIRKAPAQAAFALAAFEVPRSYASNGR